MTNAVKEVGEFADRVAGRLLDAGKDGFDIDMILQIIAAIMAAIQDCPSPTRAARIMKACHKGVKKNQWFWTFYAKREVAKAAEDDEVTAAIVEEFGELSAGTVADLV